MRCFEEGLRDEFFRLYERYMPQQYRVVDLDAQKVEFWLQVYFAVFPALPSSAGKQGAKNAAARAGSTTPHVPGANLAEGMGKLRKFIETRGRDVARTEEFLPFYALPYVPQPQYHPTFKTLFEPRWTTQLRAMVEAFLANAPDEMPEPRILTILRHYYGLVDAATNDSEMAKLADGRDAAMKFNYASLGAPSGGGGGGGGGGPSRVGAAAADYYGYGRGGAGAARVASGGGGGGGAAGSGNNTSPSKRPEVRASHQVLPRPASGGGGYYNMLGSPGGVPTRGVTPLLEGSASLHDFVPTPDLTDVGDEYYDNLDSLAAQIAALDPTKAPPPKSPATAKPPKSPADAAKGTTSANSPAKIETAARAAATNNDGVPNVPPVDVSAMSRAMSADVKSRSASATSADGGGPDVRRPYSGGGGGGGLGVQQQQEGEYTFDDLLANNEGPPVIAAPTVHYMSGGGLETHRGGPVSEREKMRVRRIMTPYRDVIFAPLDYDKIRTNLRADAAAATVASDANQAREADDRLGRLLQSLRWRLTRSAAGHPRRDAAQTLVDGDVLALRVADEDGVENTPDSLVDRLLAPGGGGGGGRGRSECLRLINALASDATGRRYLLSPGSRVVAALSSAAMQIPGGEGDTPARRHLLGALQKLSLHRRAARRMVALGVMPWIADVLLGASTSGTSRRTRAREGLEPLSDYNAEYGAALLMNLSLLPQGKRAAEKMLRLGRGSGAAEDEKNNGVEEEEEDPEDILEIVSLLLQSPNPQVRTYANGTLYSLLQRETIRGSAQALGFEELLADLAAHSDPVFVRQFTHISSLLMSDGPGPAAEPPGGAPDDDAAAPFGGYSRFDPEVFKDVEDPVGSELQEEEPVMEATPPGTKTETGAGAGAGAEEDGGLSVLLATSGRPALYGEELLRDEYLVDDVDDLGGTIDGTGGFGRETIGPDDEEMEDFLPKEEDEEEEDKAVAAAGAAAAEGGAETEGAGAEATGESGGGKEETATSSGAAADGGDAATPPAENS